jgi:RND family efflux transporter MFP subunit
MDNVGPDLSVLAREARAGWGPAGPPALSRPPSRWKTRLLAPAAILVAAAGLLAYAARDALWPGVQVRVAPVALRQAATTGPASAGHVVAQAAGWVEPDPFPVAISALTEGVVAEVLVLEGQRVAKGQAVARLVDEDTKLSLARAEAELASKEAALKADRDTWDNPVERQRAVAATQASLEEAEAELARLPLEVEAEQGRFRDLEADYKQKADIPEGGVSTLEVVQARYKMQAQAAVVKAMEGRRAVLEAKARQLAADLKAAKENLRLRIEEARALAEAQAAVKVAEAALGEAKLRLDRTAVKSPAAGVVMQRLVEPGSKVILSGDMPRSAQVARLYEPGRLQVRVDVPLADAAKVGVGQAARVTVDVLPDRVFEGVVTRAVHEADVQKNTQQFKVSIKDPAEQIKPEMLAKVKFLGAGRGGGAAAGTGGTVVFAPASLMRREGQGHWTMVLDARQRCARRRDVVIGETRYDGWVAVSSGLSPGDRLIVSSQPVSDGQRVKVVGEATEELAEGVRHGAD